MAVTKALPIAGTSSKVMKLAQQSVNRAKTAADTQSETKRALSVLAQRQATGQDTSLQQKYLQKNLGYTGPLPGQAAAQANQTTQPATVAPIQKQQPQSSQLLDQMKQLAMRETSPFKFEYNRDADPNYQAALASAQRNITAGNQQIQGDLNRRGILNSTITSDRMTANQNDTLARLETDVLPGLVANAYNQSLSTYQTNQQGDQQKISNLNALAGLYQGEEQNKFNNNMAVANQTGYYLPEGAQTAIDNILSLKQQADVKGITAAERAKLSAQADGYRAQLLSMGVDPRAYGSAVSAKNAARVTPGIRTVQGQQLDQQARQNNIQNAVAYSEMLGRVLSPQEDPSGYIRQAASGKAPLTLAAQNQQFQQAYQTNRAQVSDQQWNSEFGYKQERDQVADQQFQQEFEYRSVRDAIGDSQWQAQFDESKRQFGLEYAINQQIQLGNLSIADAQNAREQGKYEAEMAAAAQGVSVEEYAKNYVDPVVKYDPDTGAVTNPDQVESYLTSLEGKLSDYDIYQLYNRYGLGKRWTDPVPSPQ